MRFRPKPEVERRSSVQPAFRSKILLSLATILILTAQEYEQNTIIQTLASLLYTRSVPMQLIPSPVLPQERCPVLLLALVAGKRQPRGENDAAAARRRNNLSGLASIALPRLRLRVQVPPSASSFSGNEWSRRRVDYISPLRDRGEQQAAPCIGFQTFQPNNKKGASQKKPTPNKAVAR
ncbi:hypothetical protein ACFE04_019613 [Oxalis oulophora]